MVPFLSHVETDGLLITGQNPLSAGPTAKALIEFLNQNKATANQQIRDDETKLPHQKQWRENAEQYIAAKPDELI